MHRLLSRIRGLIAKVRGPSEPDFRETAVRVRPLAERAGTPPKAVEAKKPAPKKNLRFESEIGGRIEDAGPGKNVLVRNKYIREDSGTHDNLKIIDPDSLEIKEDDGIDPYNTGRFDRSQSWNSRFRK
ncbi:MAG: hypothetical protein RIA65_12510 [Woeseia sp.]